MGSQHLDDDALSDLRIVMGDEFAKLLQTFEIDSIQRIAAIQQTAAALDGEALRRAAHSFKGSAGNMGARQLSDLCRRIEDLARDGKVEQCLPIIAELSKEFSLVQAELKHYPD